MKKITLALLFALTSLAPVGAEPQTPQEPAGTPAQPEAPQGPASISLFLDQNEAAGAADATRVLTEE